MHLRINVSTCLTLITVTPEEQKQRRQEEVDKNLPRKCHNCKETYVEADNRMAACKDIASFVLIWN